MADNKQIKDGIGNLFNIRMRDLSVGGDGSLQRSMILNSSYPIDYGTGGMYHHCGKSGAMVAGLAANSPVYSFQNPSTSLLALIRRVKIGMWSTGTGFAAGIATFDLYAARVFTAQHTGGIPANLAGDVAQMRSSMNQSQASIVYANTATLTGGTRTLDTDPMETRNIGVPTTANTSILTGTTIFEKQGSEHPLFLVQNEGFIIRATVPATGTWAFAVTTEWDEVTVY